MTSAVLYRWTIKKGREAEFETAWSEATRLIHERCGSYGANLQVDPNGDYVSYAMWPSEDARQACGEKNNWAEESSFNAMRACVETRHPEQVLDVKSRMIV
ncbi:antibiotic biosynthesis monooxygenase [Maricaulis sp.]|uniref:antibiotic biosynthesis monooxygenase family protein n=1 Tax=Maricaulis sp. TaxID=1486257 RepID=UPI0026063A57|nr:antibiotic biosynthesis monooxygenase [Maricaulis sp.]